MSSFLFSSKMEESGTSPKCVIDGWISQSEKHMGHCMDQKQTWRLTKTWKRRNKKTKDWENHILPNLLITGERHFKACSEWCGIRKRSDLSDALQFCIWYWNRLADSMVPDASAFQQEIVAAGNNGVLYAQTWLKLPIFHTYIIFSHKTGHIINIGALLFSILKSHFGKRDCLIWKTYTNVQKRTSLKKVPKKESKHRPV